MRSVFLMCCVLLSATLSSVTGQSISHVAILPNYARVNIEDKYFYEREWPTLTTENNESVTWVVKSYEYFIENGRYSDVPALVECYVSETQSPKFSIPYTKIYWQKQYIWADDDYETHSELEVYAMVEGEVVDHVNLKFRLAPSQVELIDVYMEYDHNWTLTKWGDWEDEQGGVHMALPHYTMRVKRCEAMTLGWSSNIRIHDFMLNDFRGGNPIDIDETYYPPRDDMEIDGNIWTIHRRIDSSWGEWFRFEPKNRYGTSPKTPLFCTTDYFTDPAIIEQIRQYYEEDLKYHSKIDYHMQMPNDAPCQYFNLQGMPIAKPANGTIVIRKRGSIIDKILY